MRSEANPRWRAVVGDEASVGPRGQEIDPPVEVCMPAYSFVQAEILNVLPAALLLLYYAHPF